MSPCAFDPFLSALQAHRSLKDRLGDLVRALVEEALELPDAEGHAEVLKEVKDTSI